jgi:hypothetical protein
MKTAVRFALVLILSVITFVSGSGFVLGKMICLKSGNEIILPGAMDECCAGEDSDQSFISEKCCEISNLTIEQETFITSESNQFDKVLLTAVVPVLLPFALDVVLDDNNNSTLNNYGQPYAPTDPARAKLCVFNI